MTIAVSPDGLPALCSTPITGCPVLLSTVAVVMAGRHQGCVPRQGQHRRGIRTRGLLAILHHEDPQRGEPEELCEADAQPGLHALQRVPARPFPVPVLRHAARPHLRPCDPRRCGATTWENVVATCSACNLKKRWHAAGAGKDGRSRSRSSRPCTTCATMAGCSRRTTCTKAGWTISTGTPSNWSRSQLVWGRPPLRLASRPLSPRSTGERNTGRIRRLCSRTAHFCRLKASPIPVSVVLTASFHGVCGSSPRKRSAYGWSCSGTRPEVAHLAHFAEQARRRGEHNRPPWEGAHGSSRQPCRINAIMHVPSASQWPSM